MSTSYIDIDGKRIRSFDELKQLFDSSDAKKTGSRLYQTLIDLAIDSVLPDFLQNIGKAEMAEKISALDSQQSDLRIMNELQRIITGGAVDIAFDPLDFVQVLNTSIVKYEHAVQTCFEIQILKAVKEILLFSVVCGKERCEEQLNLEIYRNGEIVSVTQELPESVGEVSFLINGKEVSRECFHYNVTFQCNIPNANLLVDRKHISSSFPITCELPYGSHTIRVHYAGYRTFEEKIMVKDEHECPINLKKSPAFVGDILCTDGTTIHRCEWPIDGKTAKGIVFYVDDSGYHGWAVHLRNQGDFVWTNSDKQQLVPGLSICNSNTLALADMDGFANTKIIRSEATSPSIQTTKATPSKSHSYIASPLAFQAVLIAAGLGGAVIGNSFSSKRKSPSKSSDSTSKSSDPRHCNPVAFAVDLKNGWFVPACGQLMALMDRQDYVNDSLKKTGGDMIDSGYWSSTQKSETHAWFISLHGFVDACPKNVKGKVRAITAF